MLKNILNLKGAQQLSKKEQNTITGGTEQWCGYCTCTAGIIVYACGVSQNKACLFACAEV
jgi:hypothetical protein